MRIVRHKIDPLVPAEMFNYERSSIDKSIELTRTRPSNLSLIATKALDMSLCASAVDPESPELPKGLSIASQASAALFAVALADGATVSVPLGDGPEAIYEGAIDQSIVLATNWLRGFWCALTCRDGPSLDRLIASSPVVLARQSKNEPEYRRLLIRAICSWKNGGADTAKLLIAALEANHPDRDDIHSPDYSLKIDVPLIHCLFAVLSGDQDVEKAFVNGLELHKSYWSKTKKQRQEWLGFMSIGLTGIASLAFDRGVNLDIDSEYLPQRLIRGQTN